MDPVWCINDNVRTNIEKIWNLVQIYYVFEVIIIYRMSVYKDDVNTYNINAFERYKDIKIFDDIYYDYI